MRRLAIVVLLVLVPVIAEAQPGSQPAREPRPAPVVPAPSASDPYSETAAEVFGPLATLGAVGASALLLHDAGGNDAAAKLGISAVLLTAAPTAGHWYTGKPVTRGLIVRSIGSALLAGTTIRWVDKCLGEHDLPAGSACDGNTYQSIAALGAAAFLVGMVDDFMTAGGRARDANAAHRRLQVAPAIAPGHAGLVLAGAF